MRESKPVLFRLLSLLWGTLFFALLTAFSGWFHPGCLVSSEFFAPGLPCLPPTPPPATSGAPSDPAASSPGAQPTNIRLTVVNGSELPFSITLNGPGNYILNVASGETREFTIRRGSYSFDMMLCAARATGALDFSKITTLQFKACTAIKLVEVSVENQSSQVASVMLAGAGNFVLALQAGEVRSLTIPRGAYTVSQTVCGTTGTGTFEARSHRTLTLTCP
ncbi:MAG TPA: hypothetical protein PK530_11940 [Anaerolineales bacterium]|nr:hypothetical protein [Anaerolineales bacterium]